MKKALVILLFAASGCALHVSSDPVKIDPITVNHYVKVDRALVQAFYKEKCIADLTSPTDQELQDCVDKRVNDFLNGLAVSNIP